MKPVAILSSQVPPNMGGVSDFTKKLFERISAQSEAYLYVFGKVRAVSGFEAVPGRIFFVRNGFWGWLKIALSLRRHNIKKIAIQYTPRMYLLSGLGIVVVCLGLKCFGTGILIHGHEPYDPWNKKKVRYLFRSAIHRFIWRLLMCLCDVALVSTETETAINQKKFKFKKNHIVYCPTPSNIDFFESSPNERKALLDQFGLSGFSKRLVVFGLPQNLKHQTRLIESTVALFENRSEVGFLFIGTSKGDFPELFERFRNVRALGWLEERQVSLLLQSSHLMLAPFVWGISSKHATVAAAFLHLLPVVSTLGDETDAVFRNENLAALTSFSETEFSKRVLELFEDEKQKKDLAERAYDYYVSRLSFERTLDCYEKYFLNLRESA
jgi:glycosyltransferase involved in cell wall biosynthesis